jgi:hypothetical protein
MLSADSWELWVVVCETMELGALLNSTFWCVVMYVYWWHLLQTTLERHVNGHFNQSEAGNGNAGARRSLESASSKLFRRNGKKLRYRRQPWSGRAPCTCSHHQLLPNHMHDISSELHLNGNVDDIFIRRTVTYQQSLSRCENRGKRNKKWVQRSALNKDDKKAGKCDIYIILFINCN